MPDRCAKYQEAKIFFPVTGFLHICCQVCYIPSLRHDLIYLLSREFEFENTTSWIWKY